MTYMKPSGTLYEDSIVRSTADGGARVYVIDDEREVRRSLHFLLSTAGWLSWPFASASDFLENLEALEPAPVLLDISHARNGWRPIDEDIAGTRHNVAANRNDCARRNTAGRTDNKTRRDRVSRKAI